jgi:Putative DNA-binding domain
MAKCCTPQLQVWQAKCSPPMKVPSPEEVLTRIRAGEDARTEFKQRLPQGDRALRTLVAFANTRGGWLLLGVSDQGTIVGLEEPRAVQSELESASAQWIDPPLPLEFQVIQLEQRRILLCVVRASRRAPHRLRHPRAEAEVLVRAGASSRSAEGASLRALERGHKGAGPRNRLERQILDWLARERREALRPLGGATVERFARASNIGYERARRAFVHLELAGAILGSGHGKRRTYTLP